MQAKQRQRLARNKRKRKEKRQMKKNALDGLIQEKEKRQATEKKLFHTEKNKDKFYQLWRQAEREKEKIVQSQMTLGKILTSNARKDLATKSLLKIPREKICVEGKFSNLILGEGKFGKVKLASYRGSPVAVKEFHDDVSQAEIEREANIISSFSHLNLPVLFGISWNEKPYLLVLQFYGVAGKALTLRHCFQPSSLPLKTSNWLNVVVQLIDGLTYMHDNKVLHNDIKSDNIVLVKEENEDALYSPIIVDFGKAKHLSEVQNKRLTDIEKEIYKKRHFHIAPEIIEGSHAPSVKSDVYSMGLVLSMIYKRIKDKNLKDLCKKCLAPYSARCTSKELKDLASMIIH